MQLGVSDIGCALNMQAQIRMNVEPILGLVEVVDDEQKSLV